MIFFSFDPKKFKKELYYFCTIINHLNLFKMKKFVIFLISATLLAISVNLSAQNPYCEWNNSPPRFSNLMNLSNNIIINVEEGCGFRFVMKDPATFRWSSQNRIEITVDGIGYGSVTFVKKSTPSFSAAKIRGN